MFPDVHISFICRQDFRQSSESLEQRWPDLMSPQDEATWGDFVNYLLNLVPAIRDSTTGQLLGHTGLYWVHGGEGKPNWSIPPCGTNRTEGVANLSYLSLVMNATEDEDFRLGLSYYNAYVNEGSILAGIHEYLCPMEDLERVYIGLANTQSFDQDDYKYFYPRPEDICPRVEDDDFWENWQAYLLLVLLIFLTLALCFVLVFHGKRRRRDSAADVAPVVAGLKPVEQPSDV